MALFTPAPTYADPVLIDENKQPGQPGFSRFNPIWLKWFLDLTAVLNNAGGIGGLTHNLLMGLQGGVSTGTGERYHLTSAEYTGVGTGVFVRASRVSGINATIVTAKLTSGGANGSMTFTNGVLTAHTDAT